MASDIPTLQQFQDSNTEPVLPVGQRNITEYDLFNNPMIAAARAAMSPEQLHAYQTQGEYMFSFEQTMMNAMDAGPESIRTVQASLDSQPNYTLEDIQKQLRAGLHPTYCTPDETRMLEERYGPEWYRMYGWDSLEL